MQLTQANLVCCRCRGAWSFKEYGAMCASCWSKATAEERAIIRGEEPPVQPQGVRYVMPPAPSVASRWFVRLWRVGVSAAVAWLAFKQLAR